LLKICSFLRSQRDQDMTEKHWPYFFLFWKTLLTRTFHCWNKLSILPRQHRGSPYHQMNLVHIFQSFWKCTWRHKQYSWYMNLQQARPNQYKMDQRWSIEIATHTKNPRAWLNHVYIHYIYRDLNLGSYIVSTRLKQVIKSVLH